jgi:hypothetical protein
MAVRIYIIALTRLKELPLSILYETSDCRPILLFEQKLLVHFSSSIHVPILGFYIASLTRSKTQGWVALTQFTHHMLLSDVSVALGGGYRSVPQKLLYDANVQAVA